MINVLLNATPLIGTSSMMKMYYKSKVFVQAGHTEKSH